MPASHTTFIADVAEVAEQREFPATLIPGLIQTRAYALEVIGIGRETDEEESLSGSRSGSSGKRS